MGYGDVSGCQGLAVAKPDDEALFAHRTGEWEGHVQSLVGWFPVVRGHGPRPHVACDRGCAWAGGGLGYVSLLVVCVRQFDDHESDQRSGVGGDGLVGCSEGIFQTWSCSVRLYYDFGLFNAQRW